MSILLFFFFVTADIMPILCLYMYFIFKNNIQSARLLSVKCVKPADFNACQICNVTYNMAVFRY